MLKVSRVLLPEGLEFPNTIVVFSASVEPAKLCLSAKRVTNFMGRNGFEEIFTERISIFAAEAFEFLDEVQNRTWPRRSSNRDPSRQRLRLWRSMRAGACQR